MLGSIPHKKLSFYHLPTRGRAGIKLGDANRSPSVIFDCFMPLFYNFHTLLATIYMIFLDYHIDPVPSACSYFSHVFCLAEIHIKRSPNMMKFYKELFWNICDFGEKEST